MQWIRGLLAILVVVISFITWSCDPEQEFVTGNAVDISFSLDTLRFDTVFTELGSATRFVKIYNRSNEPVQLDEIYVEGTTGVEFRINVDGAPGGVVEDAIIWDNDSLYVFVEVEVDPDQPTSVSPFVIEDQLVVKTGSKEKRLLLEAWGQNAIYLPNRFSQGVFSELTCNNNTIRWDSDLPYVIYGAIFIRDCLLEVAAGTRIYVHGGLVQTEEDIYNDGILYTLQGGSIHFAGTQEAPITVQGDRLEPAFADAPGQWLGIIIGRGSRGSLFEHTIIKNSQFGIFADSASEVSLRNTIIHATSANAIIGVHAEVQAQNSLFYDNGSGAIAIRHGGDYQFDHCTATSYGVDASALFMRNFECYNQDCTDNSVYRLRADFRNCIFVGSRRDEIILQDAFERQDPDFWQLNMDHCLVKVDELLDGRYSDFFSTYCIDCFNADQDDPLFLDVSEDDYHLDTLSVAQNRGLVIPELPLDLDGVPRDEMPDVGCYERVD
jgi:hypothetical protein